MAFPLRSLISVLLGAVSLSAQPDAPVVFRTFSASLDTDIAGLFYDLRDRQIPVSANNRALSSPYVSPPGGLVSFYRELPPVPPEEKPRRIPVAEVRLGSGGPWLVLLADQPDPAAPGQSVVRAHAIDAS
jgi:hypothetical protein